ncbi:uncharacterized protein C14orf119 homolog [Sardina pilchardus]|uniref:uncharacterized protein C14orf119 homolog n=1 Tax=Sardina pilchardus TaxID=27697 RepID=UPI002E0E4CEE
MSWFAHVRQDLIQQPSTVTPPFETAEHNRIYSSPSSSADFPNAPLDFKPPSLVDLACTPLGSGSGRVSPPLSYVTLQEQRCVLSWFLGWGPTQRQHFLEDLIAKAVPGKVCSLLEQLTTMEVKDRVPNIFECQLRLWTQWFESWTEEERNSFINCLEERDPIFVAHFYRGVAGTAGRN